MSGTTGTHPRFSLGPWQILPEEVNRDYIRIRGTRLGGKYKIANVCGMKEALDLDAIETRANANLIAAAPDMYHALIDMIRDADSMGWNVENAKAAIAKAEGKSK